MKVGGEEKTPVVVGRRYEGRSCLGVEDQTVSRGISGAMRVIRGFRFVSRARFMYLSGKSCCGRGWGLMIF